jgi:hypothetical protein
VVEERGVSFFGFVDFGYKFHWFVGFVKVVDGFVVFDLGTAWELVDIVEGTLQIESKGVFLEKADTREFGGLSIFRVINSVVFPDDFLFMLNIVKADNLKNLSLVLGDGLNKANDIGLGDVEEDEDDFGDFAGDPETVPDVESELHHCVQ